MPHDLSILNELVEEDPIEISVSAKHAARLPQADVAYLHLNYQSDFIASLQASWLSPSKIRQTILTGRKKMVVYDDVDVVQKVKVLDKGIEELELADREKTYTQFIQYRQGDVYSPSIPTTEALKIEIEHLVDCLDRNQTCRTSGYQGLRVVQILDFADQLARSKSCWATLPLRLAA
jgi:predicted dehydrogenase